MKKIVMTVPDIQNNEPIFGYWWADAIMSGAARVWTFYADLGARLLSPFAALTAHDHASDTATDSEESGGEDGSEDESGEEAEQLELLQQLAHTTVALREDDQTDAHAEAEVNLFQLMVSTGIIEFTTQGHLFKLVPHVTVTPIPVESPVTTDEEEK